MRPFGVTVREKLLEHIEAHLPVIERIAQIAAFENPRGRNPTERQIEETLDLVGAARARIGKDRHVRLASNLEFRQHRSSIVAAVPDRDKVEFNLRILFDRFEPAATFQFRLAIRTPGRPEMNNA